MKTAGMTHGGFYNHFASKDDLALEVLHRGFHRLAGGSHAIRKAHPALGPAALHDMRRRLRRPRHRDHPEIGCASAALVSDAGRHGIAAQAEYHRGLDGYFAAITEMLLERARQSGAELDPDEARERAVALFSQMVGALVVARAVADAAPELSDEVLTVNRRRLTSGD